MWKISLLCSLKMKEMIRPIMSEDSGRASVPRYATHIKNRSLRRDASGFPLGVKDLLQASLQLRDRYQEGEISEHGVRTATGRLEAQLDRLLEKSYRDPANRRLAKHLAHERPFLFTFLYCPGLDATNHEAERAVRWMVIAQSVGREPDLGRSADSANPGERTPHVLAAGQGPLSAAYIIAVFTPRYNPGHCPGRGLDRANSRNELLADLSSAQRGIATFLPVNKYQ